MQQFGKYTCNQLISLSVFSLTCSLLSVILRNDHVKKCSVDCYMQVVGGKTLINSSRQTCNLHTSFVCVQQELLYK